MFGTSPSATYFFFGAKVTKLLPFGSGYSNKSLKVKPFFVKGLFDLQATKKLILTDKLKLKKLL